MATKDLNTPTGSKSKATTRTERGPEITLAEAETLITDAHDIISYLHSGLGKSPPGAVDEDQENGLVLIYHGVLERLVAARGRINRAMEASHG